MTRPRALDGLLLVLLFVLLVIVSLSARPLFPVAETRYVSVAWEMMSKDLWLVPHLNGEPYSHKPPLPFWLFIIGWKLVGPCEWWPRVVTALFMAAATLLTWRVAGRLWPGERAAASLVPWLLLGSALWLYCCSTLMLDCFVTLFTLLGLLGTLTAAAGRRSGWVVLAAAVALGLLTKGPVILLYILPVALSAPWWQGTKGLRKAAWYPALLAATACGAALALCWALPAALAGGSEYGRALFWGQTADRLLQSFAHARPWWWYLPFIPAIVLPWPLWPPLWRGLAALIRRPLDGGTRFCIAALVPPVVIFSLISGKQTHYLLALLPSMALLAARALASAPSKGRWLNRLPLGLAFGVIGAFLLTITLLSPVPELPVWTAGIPAWTGGALLLAGLLLPLLPIKRGGTEIKLATAGAVFLLVVLTLGVAVPAAPAQDVREVGLLIHRLQQEGRTVAHAAKYAGQYHFAGRLEEPLQVISSKRIAEWAAANPGGAVVVYYWERPPAERVSPLLARPYRGRYVTVWLSEDAIHIPMPARSSTGVAGAS
jgi:4-amino-4-deoxy-L-arabinose transferase-like glycosyltransferase